MSETETTADGAQRTWTETGAEALEHTRWHRGHVHAAIGRLEWVDATIEQPAMPAGTITAAIRQLRLPKVSLVAISSDLAPYGLYGIEARFKNGRARVYLLDRGADAPVLASDFWPRRAQVTS